MTSANLLSIHALQELRGALARFCGETQETLQSVQIEIHRTMEWLSERANYWRNQIRQRQEAVLRAQSALANCQASASYDSRTGQAYVPDCSAYAQALVQARVRLREAEDEYRNVQQWSQLIQQAVIEYERQAQHLSGICFNEIPKATGLLERKAVILVSYVGLHLISTARSAPISHQATDSSQEHFQQSSGELQISDPRQIYEYMFLDDALDKGHRILFRHADLICEDGAGFISWDGAQLHLWEVNPSPGRDASVDSERQRLILEKIAAELNTDDAERPVILDAIQSNRIVWHFQPAPATGDMQDNGQVSATDTGQTICSEDVTRVKMPAEFREGSRGGPERLG